MNSREIAQFLQGSLEGGTDSEIFRVNGFETAGAGEISFLERAEIPGRTNASVLIVPENFAENLDIPIIKVKNPKLAFARLAAVLHPPKKRAIKVHQSALVSESAVLGKDLFIGAF